MSDKYSKLVYEIECALKDDYGWQQTLIARVGVEVLELLLRKNRNYGGSVFTVPVLAPDVDVNTAIRVRMSDKVARLQTLLKGDKDLVGESIEDTFMDLLGYIILLIAYHRDRKEDTESNDPCCVHLWSARPDDRQYKCTRCGEIISEVTYRRDYQ